MDKIKIFKTTQLMTGAFLLAIWITTTSFSMEVTTKMLGAYSLLLGLFLITDYNSNQRILKVVFNGK